MYGLSYRCRRVFRWGLSNFLRAYRSYFACTFLPQISYCLHPHAPTLQVPAHIVLPIVKQPAGTVTVVTVVGCVCGFNCDPAMASNSLCLISLGPDGFCLFTYPLIDSVDVGRNFFACFLCIPFPFESLVRGIVAWLSVSSSSSTYMLLADAQ